mgnify:CR=1 FL=1
MATNRIDATFTRLRAAGRTALIPYVTTGDPSLQVTLDVMRAGYQINLYGTKGWRSVQPDLKDLYSYLLEAFLDLVQTGRESVPVEEEVEVIAALEAGERSLREGREVTLAEVLAR